MEGSSRRLLLTSLWVYVVVISSQAELRTRMRATLDGIVLQDLGKPILSAIDIVNEYIVTLEFGKQLCGTICLCKITNLQFGTAV